MSGGSGYDVIGDVHGELDALERLLAKMDYAKAADGLWRHPDRTAVFVGDLVDRGPHQLETIDLVRRMLAAGTALAVMGNHELNAIGYMTEDGTGSHFRPRSSKNRRQHQAFLREVGEDSALHREMIDFFKTLPFFLDFPCFRVVHACWHQPSVDRLRPHLDRRGLVAETSWPQLLRDDTEIGRAIDVLLKGPELELPNGRTFVDKDGHERTAVRIKWWDADAVTYRRAAISVPGDDIGELPDDLLREDHRYHGDIPVFFGHYWMAGQPALASDRTACVDFSVAKAGGYLAAYRWSGERALSPDHLVHVPAVARAPESSH